MAKAPITLETILAGELAVTVSSNGEKAWACIGGYSGIKINSLELRALADQIDRMGQAAKIAYAIPSETVFSINYVVDGRENSTDIFDIDSLNAISQFKSVFVFDEICSVYNNKTKEYVDYPA